MNILNIEHISKVYGEKVIFDDISCGIQEGEKIGIIGINGTGKSTLLRILAGLEEGDEGQVIMQNGVRMAYLPQNPQFPADSTVLDYVADGRWRKEWGTESEAGNVLNKLGLTDHQAKISHLSGGQKKRAALARILVNPSDILILDEPTNHLDIASREWIEEAVEAYDGTLLFVSHDRYFINRFATRIWEVANGTITDYPMGFAQYRQVKAQEESEKAETTKPVKEKTVTEKPVRGDRAQQAARRQLTICEREIAKAEERIGALDAEMEANACDYEKLNALVADKDAAQAELDALYLRWEELSEAAGEA